MGESLWSPLSSMPPNPANSSPQDLKKNIQDLTKWLYMVYRLLQLGVYDRTLKMRSLNAVCGMHRMGKVAENAV